ncbi:hypothetical protein LTR66_015311 [Elasticomyces elasticus]|nr:hypothetical protein LTR66_015311 [Elasticomyces elasticus]
MWLQAIDVVLDRLKEKGVDLSRVKANLNPTRTLENQLDGAFASPHSPNWQDASTENEGEEFDACLGDPVHLAQATGSKAHHRFTGPQILRFQRKYPDRYQKTARINLVSSFLASIFLGRLATFDISDVCGMNLWDIKSGTWLEKSLELTAGTYGAADLKQKLGTDVTNDGGRCLGMIASYFQERFGFSKDCSVIVSTGDNPSTILALPLQPNDAIVSLGTSSTFLMSTPEYRPDPAVHFFNHPTTSGLYMFMLCYKNGGLAREKIRDEINKTAHFSMPETRAWDTFDKCLLTTDPLAQRPGDPAQLGIFFPRPEIVPNLPAGTWHFELDLDSSKLEQQPNARQSPGDEPRLIIESQFLSMRLRSKNLVKSPGRGLPAQPRRIYLVGGGSRNKAIAKVCGEVLGGSDGVYKLDLGENACALGAAYKAVWACERQAGQSFEDLISARWDEKKFVERIADGYQKDLYELYGKALDGFEKAENMLLEEHDRQKKGQLK